PFVTGAYWLQLSPLASDVRASAEIERATNTIRLDTRGVASAALFLNDELVDLSQPLHLICNGVEHTTTVARTLASFLELAYDGTSDPGAVYVARADVDLATAAGSDGEFEPRLAAAGSDVAKLLELHQWCAENQHKEADARVLRAIVRLDPANEAAHTALGHVRGAGHWFPSQAALERQQAR